MWIKCFARSWISVVKVMLCWNTWDLSSDDVQFHPDDVQALHCLEISNYHQIVNLGFVYVAPSTVQRRAH